MMFKKIIDVLVWSLVGVLIGVRIKRDVISFDILPSFADIWMISMALLVITAIETRKKEWVHISGVCSIITIIAGFAYSGLSITDYIYKAWFSIIIFTLLAVYMAFLVCIDYNMSKKSSKE